MRRTMFFLGLLALSLSRQARAIEAVVNHAVFFKANGGAYVELYWQINTSSLHYHKDSTGKISAKIQTRIRITGDTGVVFSDAYYLQTPAFDPDKSQAPALFELSRADIPFGHLKLELQLSDGHSGSDYYYQDTLSVTAVAGPFYSTLQLLDTFVRDTKPGRLSKGEYQHLPKTLAFYDEGQRSFHAYTELYRTGAIPESKFPLIQSVWLSKRKGEHDLPGFLLKDTIAKASPVLAFRHSFSLSELASGNYYLNTSLSNASGAVFAGSDAFFQLINKHPDIPKSIAADTQNADATVPGNVLDLGRTFVAKFDMPQLRAILKMLLPAADPVDEIAIKGFLARPDELYMRYFIFNHFSNQNKADPARAWKLFSDKVREANKYYASGSTMGYETDRGVIYLKYGEPAEVIRIPAESGAQPYEIWRYNVGGKVTGSGLFLFYSPGYMRSDFRLLHSTVIGERNNPDWRSVLYTNGSTSGKINSRADEYFK